MPYGKTKTPTRYPNGVTNVTPQSPLFRIEHPSPIHQLSLGTDYNANQTIPTGNTPTTNAAWTVTSVTSAGTASLAAAAVWPPTNLLTTGTTANDQVVLQDKRLVKKAHLTLMRKVIVFGSFQITSTVANAAIAIGMFSGTSIAALGNDLFTFNKPTGGATLNFLNRNNGGTTLTTPVSTAVTINTLYGVAAYLDPFKLEVLLSFGVIDSLDLQLSTLTSSNIDLPPVNRATVATTNIPDGTNSIQFGFGAQTTAGAAATVQFGPCGAIYVQ